MAITSTPHRTRLMNRRRKKSVLPIVLVAPTVILLLLFTIAPALYAIQLSLVRDQVAGDFLGSGGTVQVFVGLQNYIDTVADPEFWRSLGRMLLVGLIWVPLTIALAVTFALCLDAKHTRFTTATRLAIFLPYAVPGVIASLLWGFLYLPATSPIGGDRVNYFGNNEIFLSVANVAVWGAVGFNMVIIYTAVRALPRDLFEAAELDGASELQIALRVKLPLIAPSVAMVALFSVIGALQLFNEPTTLKPLANAITSTWTPLMRVYTDALVNSNVNTAAAATFMLLVLIVGATLAINAIGRMLARREGAR